MNGGGYLLFDTALGRCGLAWRGEAVCGASLPEPDEARAHVHLRRRSGAGEGPPPDFIRKLVEEVQAMLTGSPVDLGAVRLDESGVEPFDSTVYAAARAIPPGATATYGEIATALGDVALARRVGQALGRNPFPIIVPCHRVLAAGGATGGFSARGGVATKLRLLNIERAATSPEPLLFAVLPLAAR